ncbi:MAG: polyprenyl diphosphate synthase [Bacteroidetes bacterium]|nr:polyprenyl diphosphate synthase [Bacteroidota bacterium]MCL5026504.1 polyprenyl diphosphate synthase [Chloroflexota bacterium]
MDGNGRWAQQRGLPRVEGHRAGTRNIRTVLQACTDFGIQVLTIYAFSTENWNRPVEEVKGLMSILMEVITEESEEMHRQGARLCHLGRTDGLSPEMCAAIHRATELTKNNTRITLNVAFNYGGRAEILDAVKRILREGVDPSELTEEKFSHYLYTGDQPDPDLVIRTASEMRLSNFLVWQAAYAEYYSTPTYWPDFGREELQKALAAYNKRERRFGRL